MKFYNCLALLCLLDLRTLSTLSTTNAFVALRPLPLGCVICGASTFRKSQNMATPNNKQDDNLVEHCQPPFYRDPR
jgi:hypothetical protein